MMDKRSKRMFIVTLTIREQCWNYKIGQVINSAIISNSLRNAYETFQDTHCGGEYPSYQITNIEDTCASGFFMPDISSKNLM
jgi:hypothetical protein